MAACQYVIVSSWRARGIVGCLTTKGPQRTAFAGSLIEDLGLQSIANITRAECVASEIPVRIQAQVRMPSSGGTDYQWALVIADYRLSQAQNHWCIGMLVHLVNTSRKPKTQKLPL